jgi:hypothetical protein
MIEQNEAHMNSEIMEYMFERIDKDINYPCHQWVGPKSKSKSNKGIFIAPRMRKIIDGEQTSLMPHIIMYNYYNYADKKSPLHYTKGDEIRRTCNNLLCVNILHLKLSTREETIQASIDRGTTATGNDFAVKYDADMIRTAHESGKSYKDIMKMFGIPSKGTISYIINKAKR